MPQAPARRATSASSDVAKLVTLHHRRRGWAWVAVGSVIGLAVYAGIDASLFANLTGAAEILSVIPVFVLLALVLVGLSCRNRRYIAHSPRRRGRPDEGEGQRFALPGVRSRAQLSATPSWQLGVCHRRARRDDRYRPVSPARPSELVGICGRRGAPGHLQPGVVWSVLHSYIPIRRLPHSDRGLPFQKRRGRHLGQPGAARPAVQCPQPGLGLGQRADPHQWRGLGDRHDHREPVLRRGSAPAAVHPARDSARHVVGAKLAESVPARADPGAVRQPPHPNRGHHGSGARRPARRGQRRR